MRISVPHAVMEVETQKTATVTPFTRLSRMLIRLVIKFSLTHWIMERDNLYGNPQKMSIGQATTSSMIITDFTVTQLRSVGSKHAIRHM